MLCSGVDPEHVNISIQRGQPHPSWKLNIQLTGLDADMTGTLQERATGLIDQILRLQPLEVWPGPAFFAASVVRSPSPLAPLPVSELYTTLQGEPIFNSAAHTFDPV
jgi:hypothetical protein